MFERFEANLGGRLVEPTTRHAWEDPRLLSAIGYRELSGRFAGCTFGDGIYRIHDSTSGPLALARVIDAFPEFAGRARPFGFDWLGRQFALDSGRREGDEPLVLLLEPGTGEALEIPQTLVNFHDEELVDYRDAALAESFFRHWRDRNPAVAPLAFDHCVGYRIPLFLGGSDSVDNLEVIDTDVYWTLTGQLIRGTVKVAPGTPITDIRREQE